MSNPRRNSAQSRSATVRISVWLSRPRPPSSCTVLRLAGLCDFAHSISPGRKETVLFWNTLNTRDFSEVFQSTDYHDLPRKLHWVFEPPLPDFQLADKYERYCEDLDFQNRGSPGNRSAPA